MDNLYSRFMILNPGVKIGRSRFHSYRPRNVKLASETPMNQCLCEVCANFDFKFFCLSLNISGFPTTKTTLLKATLCQSEGPFFMKNCVDMRCSQCGPPLIDHIVGLSCNLNKPVCLKQWTQMEINGVKRKTVVSLECSLGDVLEMTRKELGAYVKHNFNARWQYHQFSSKKESLLGDELLMVLDFGENYRTEHQDEVQAAHWAYGQITIHPIVCYYRCKECPGLTITHSVVVISNDNQHDPHAVHTFLKKTRALLEESLGGSMKSIYFWSDGCPTQYKSKTAFYLFQEQGQQGLQQSWNFFGSRHGKNPSDGESAVVKSAARRAVKTRKAVIQTSHQLFEFLVANLSKPASTRNGVCNHYQRSFIHVDKTEIKRPKLPQIRCITGTRSIHTITTDNTRLSYRSLTCYCPGCSAGADCGVEYVDAWQHFSYPVKEVTQVADNEESGLEELSTSTLNYLQNLTDAVSEDAEALEQNLSVTEPQAQANDESPPRPTQNKGHLQIGSWVVASFPSRIPSAGKKFLGMVLAIDDGEANIKFCRQNGRYFTWPLVEDVGWMPTYALNPIEPPNIDGRERMTITEAEMALL